MIQIKNIALDKINKRYFNIIFFFKNNYVFRFNNNINFFLIPYRF